jgi:hypothetical protein
MPISPLRHLAPLVLALAAPALAQNCMQASVGLTPLSDLGGGLYRGAQGGLYPGGQNTRPDAHEVAGQREAALVVPRDAAGAPDPDGKIGFISIGMSNTRNHFQAFGALAANDPLRDPRVAIVNTAQGGQPAESMLAPDAPYWDFVAARLAQAQVAPAQVQVIWFLQANAGPSGTFPAHAETLRDQFRTILDIARDKYPNARLAFVAARIYAGYATTGLNPEPYAYEQAFANKWLVRDQIAGNPDFNFDPDQGEVHVPWLAWGPYMWADGLTPRSDGLTWECADFQQDGTHPSAQGATKVGAALLAACHGDTTMACWYSVQPSPARFGSGKAAASGIAPRIDWTGTPSLAQDDLVISVHDAPGGQFSVGFFSPTPTAVPFFGGTRYVGHPLVRLDAQLTDALGSASYAIPVVPPMVGERLVYQFFVRDPQHPDGSGAVHSDALAVCFW